MSKAQIVSPVLLLVKLKVALLLRASKKMISTSSTSYSSRRTYCNKTT